MKKRFFASIAAAVLTLSACTLHAGAAYETTTADTWNGMQKLDDKGMLSYGGAAEYGVYITEDGAIYRIIPHDWEYRFVLKPGLDADEAVREIVSGCYPDDDSFDVSYNGYTDQPYYIVYDYTEEPDVYADAVMQALLSKGLISAFYGIGQVGEIAHVSCNSYLTAYGTDPQVIETIQQYIDTAGLDCALQYYDHGEKFPNGNEVYLGGAYCVVSNETITRAELFELAADIYEATGYASPILIPDDSATSVNSNALERPGDLNIDGAADVSDAVLLARIIAEDDNMPAICDTGYLNADVDGDGLLTILDVTALLAQIADIPV